MITMLTAGLMAGSLWLPFQHHADPASGAPPKAAHAQHFRATSRWRIGRWLLTVRRDRFTSGAICQIERRRQSVERQALVLRLPPKVDTANANYRVDAGAAVNVADDRPALAIQGFQVWKDQLNNPSGAVVRIPLARLADARTVWVETRLNGRVWIFRVEGLTSALAAARREGCPRL